MLDLVTHPVSYTHLDVYKRQADIQVDQDIEIMNPETVIATLNGGADVFLIARDFKFMIISVTSSLTPGIELNS